MADNCQNNIGLHYYASVQRGLSCCGSFRRRDGDRSCLADRGRVDGFTASSRGRLRKQIRNADAHYRVFVTLTYPPGYGVDGRRCKRDLDAFAKRYRAYAEARAGARARVYGRAREGEWSMLWWMEWQGNGRVHYHLLGTDYVHYDLIARWWYEIVGSGNTDHLAAGTQIVKIRGNSAQTAAYALKYAAKLEQKTVPEGYSWPGRYWGVRGNRRLVSATTTWQAARHGSGDVQLALEEVRKVRKTAKEKGTMADKVIEGDGWALKIWIWRIEQDQYRVILQSIYARINV